MTENFELSEAEEGYGAVDGFLIDDSLHVLLREGSEDTNGKEEFKSCHWC